MKSPSEREDEKQYLDYERLTGRIELNDVSFSYPESDQAALKNINVKIRTGEKIAVIDALALVKQHSKN